MKCPKCSGRIIPAPDFGIDGKRCFVCGWIKLGQLEVVKPEIPPVGQALSTNPRAVYERDLYQRIKANGGPLRKGKNLETANPDIEPAVNPEPAVRVRRRVKATLPPLQPRGSNHGTPHRKTTSSLHKEANS